MIEAINPSNLCPVYGSWIISQFLAYPLKLILRKVNFLLPLQFKGSRSALSLNHTWSCESICEFEYGWYPFDVQNCFLHGYLPGKIIQETRVKNVTYSGRHDLGKYTFRSLKFCNVDKYGRLGIFVDLSFKRPLTGHFITMFLPTGMLLLISQMSTTFSGTFLEMVIEVNTTLLLVLTTL